MMRQLVRLYRRLAGSQYSCGKNSKDKELSDLSNNRLQRCDYRSQEQLCQESVALKASSCDEESDCGVDKKAVIDYLFEDRKRGQVLRQPKCLFVTLVLGFFALGAGCFIVFLHPYDFFFTQKVVLQDGGEIFEMWRKPEVDLYVKVFLFNVTNAEEYMSGVDDKLKMQEIGPYVYKEGFEHEVTGFNDNGTLSAIPRHPLTWVGDLSEGNREDDIVYLPHIALLSIANVASKQSFFARLGLNNVIRLTGSKPLARMTAKEFMMGYESNLMTLGNTFMPGWIYFDKLGLIDRMYDFNGDYETIFTGEQDVRLAGLIDTYKGSTDLPQWHGKHCSNVQYASDGTKFKGGVTKNESVLFFRKNLCRPAPLVPTGEGVRSGLHAYMYTLPDHMLDNGKYNEENKCFCREGICLPEGLIDVTDCYYGFPIALSYPHFYKGDPILSEKIVGLKPNKELHETRFWVEPKSGLPLDVSAKFQINMALGDISNIQNTERFSHMYLPLLWFDIRMYSLPPSMESRFGLYLNILPSVERSAMYCLFASGALLIIFSVYRLTFKIMFKGADGKKRNFFRLPSRWVGCKSSRSKINQSNLGKVYNPCEVEKIPHIERRASYKVYAAELGQKLSDKVCDTADNVKNMVIHEFANVKNACTSDRRGSALNRSNSNAILNESDKNDSSDGENYTNGYGLIGQMDSDDENNKFSIEIVDDQVLDDPNANRYERRDSCARLNRLDQLESESNETDIILKISD